MSLVIFFSFYLPTPMRDSAAISKSQDDAFRIVYYHVPMAWVTVVAYFTSIFFGVRYLKSKHWQDDERALTAAGLGTVFCIMATVSGSVFAKIAWGAYWNWDPRQVSIFVLLLIYGSYFALRGAVSTDSARGTLSSVYSILAAFAVPFFVFILPRMSPSLHPNRMDMTGFGPRGVFISSFICFTVLFFWMLQVAFRARLFQRMRNREI
jgi:heme exporter protein C